MNYARKAIKIGVEDYEKKGTKLYSISILPFLLYFLREDASACHISAPVVLLLLVQTLFPYLTRPRLKLHQIQ